MKKLLLTLLIPLFFSCNKNSARIDATIWDYGSEANGGCGWLIEIGGITYKPTHLSDLYQQHGLSVKVEYYYFNSQYNCELGNSTYDKVKITAIK